MMNQADIQNDRIVNLGIANQMIADELALKITAQAKILIEIKVDKKEAISKGAQEYLESDVFSLLDALIFLKGPQIAKKYNPNQITEIATKITSELLAINNKSFGFIYGSLLELIRKNIPDI